MEVKINVDESQFKDLLENELKALKPEELHEIMLECIKGYFTQNNYENLEPLLVKTKNQYGWAERSASDFTRGIIAGCDYSKLQDVVDLCIDKLKENHDHILKEILLESIVSGLTSSYRFKDEIDSAIREELYRIRQVENNNSY